MLQDLSDITVAKKYLMDNKPNDEVLARFEQALNNWGVVFPVYCEETDSIYGLVQLMFTVAIMSEVEENAYNERYCFSNPDLAIIELAKWHQRKFGDKRPVGWIATRNVSSAKSFKESFEHHYRSDYAHELLPYTSSLVRHEIEANSDVVMSDLGIDKAQFDHYLAYLYYSGQIG